MAIDEKPILSAPPPSRAWGRWALLVVVLLGLGYGIRGFYRRTIARHEEELRREAAVAKAPPSRVASVPPDPAGYPIFGFQMGFRPDNETYYSLRPEEIRWARDHEEILLTRSIRLEPVEGGLAVESIAPRSIFEYRGWRKGDIVRKVNDVPVRSLDDVRKALENVRSGATDQLKVALDREGKRLTLSYGLVPARPLPAPPPSARAPRATREEYGAAAQLPEYREDLFNSSLLGGGAKDEIWSIAGEEVEWIERNLEKVLTNDLAGEHRESGGFRITRIRENSVLAARGFQEGDVVLKFQDRKVEQLDDLRAGIAALREKPPVYLQIVLERDGRALSLTYRYSSKGSNGARASASDEQELQHAVAIGYVPTLKRELARVTPPDGTLTPQQAWLLTLAVQYRRKNVVRYLLERGADVHSGGAKGYGPLLSAASLDPGDPAIVKLLLDRGARTDVVDSAERSPLALACKAGSLEVLALLLDKGADLEARDKNSSTPLLAALAAGKTDAVRLLVSRGANVNVRDAMGNGAPLLALYTRSLPLLELIADAGGGEELERNGELLAIAVQGGDLSIVKYLIARGLIRKGTFKGLKPLHAALRTQNVEILQLLLREGMDSRREGFGRVLLESVSERTTMEVVKALTDDLLAKGGTLDDPLRVGATAALLARERGNPEIAAELLKRGAKDLRNAGKGDAALNRKLVGAIISGTDRQIQQVLEEGADPEARDAEGRSALCRAAERDRVTILDLLLEKGADVNARGYHSETALLRAAEVGHARSVRLLLKKGADPQANAWEQNLMDRILDYGYPWVEYLLHKAGVRETPSPHRKWTRKIYDTEEAAQRDQELLQAVERKNLTGVESALGRGADPAVRGRNRYPVLSIAVETGDIAIVAALVAKGAPLDAPGERGKTPLMRALERRFEEIGDLLLKKGADVDVEDEWESTCLHTVVEWDVPGLASAILEKSRKVNAKNKAGWTPLHSAASRGWIEFVGMLLDRGANVANRTSGKATALNLAAYAGYADTVGLLADRGADVNAASSEAGDETDWTPLMRAAGRGHEAVVRMLLQKKATPRYSNSSGESALSIARKANHPSIVKLLQDAGAER